MSQYYAASILATRSARAIERMQRAARALQDAPDHASQAAALKAHDRARCAYNRAQEMLATLRPLSAADIAARQADYPKARE